MTNALDPTGQHNERDSLWQPIDTAPRDGTKIVVAYPGKYLEVWVRVVSWADKPLGGIDNWDYINSHCGSPKYWQPYTEGMELPLPPADGVFHGRQCDCDTCVNLYEEIYRD